MRGHQGYIVAAHIANVGDFDKTEHVSVAVRKQMNPFSSVGCNKAIKVRFRFDSHIVCANRKTPIKNFRKVSYQQM